MSEILDRYAPNSENGVVIGAYDSGAEQIARAAALASSPLMPAGQRTTIGSPSSTLAASTTTEVTITVRLRGGNTFVGHRLILPAEYASSVRVTALKVNATDILASSDPIPGEVFSSDAQRGGELPFLPCTTNSVIVLTLQNETAAAITNACFAVEGVILP